MKAGKGASSDYRQPRRAGPLTKSERRAGRPPNSQAGTPALRSAGFALIELLAIISLLALAALLLTPALAKVKPSGLAFQCLNNARQLAVAVAMYSADNHDFFPPNPDDGNTLTGYNWVDGNVSGGMPPGAAGAVDLCNPDNLSNSNKCLVAPYLGGKTSVFKCPADPRYGPYSGSDPTLKGKIMPAVRSVSVNGGVGTVDPGFANGGGHSGKPTLPVNGPWLDGSHSHRANSPYATFGKTTDFGVVTPSQILLTVDEDPWSINDGSFAVIAAKPEWIDFPAVWHDHGCTFSFCDSHAELHKWTGTSLGLTGEPTIKPVSASDPDWLWVVSHATVKLQ